jgi:Tol biopolymer transport system component
VTLNPGTRLGPYEISAPLGVGGMGEVYRATDTSLKRQVAIKVLPASLANDSDRLMRFQREAEVLAKLNDPHIAQIYGLEKADGVTALVMELVEGPTLADRIAKGPIPLDEALPIAEQIAEALEAAHEQGIIHRDLKPANVKVRTDGMVKVLDFGLAKAFDPIGSNAGNATTSPTITSPAMTQAGIILGTAAYMSPEQARGRAVDKRSDVWSFGCVLYEMLTGRHTFNGDDISMTLATVLKGEPDFSLLPAATPPSVQLLLARCLKKEPRMRLRDIGEARVLIEELRGATAIDSVTDTNFSSPSDARRRSARANALPWAVAGALAVALGAGGVWQYALRPQPIPGVARLTIDLPEQLGQPGGFPPSLAASPDGRYVVFNGQTAEGIRLWLRPLQGQIATPLAGTDDASAPFWAPDSRQIGFISGTRVHRVNIETGVVETVADFFRTASMSSSGSASGVWSPDGQTILFALGQGSGIFRASVRGGDVSRAVEAPAGQSSLSRPEFLGDNDHFAYLANTGSPETSGIYVSSLSGGGRTLLMKGLTEARYVSPALLVFNKERALMAQRFDLGRRTLSGDPTVIADGVDFFFPSSNAFSVADIVVYRSAGLSQTRFTWFGRNGAMLSPVGEPSNHTTMMLSPNARRLVFARREPTGVQNLWVLDLDRGTTTRLTFGTTIDSDGTWSPDGQHIVFASVREGKKSLYEISSNGEGERLLLESKGQQLSMDAWSGDGRFIVYHIDSAREMWAMPMTGDDRTPLLVAKSVSGRVDEPAFSPDSKWISYNVNDTGRHEIYVKRFPPTDAKWQVSRDGGVQARWRRDDGRELYFLAPDGGMMAVDVSLGETPTFGQPHKLFDTRLAFSFQTDQYAVTADGQRFLIMNPLSDRKLPPFNVVMNWRSLVPR